MPPKAKAKATKQASKQDKPTSGKKEKPTEDSKKLKAANAGNAASFVPDNSQSATHPL